MNNIIILATYFLIKTAIPGIDFVKEIHEQTP